MSTIGTDYALVYPVHLINRLCLHEVFTMQILQASTNTQTPSDSEKKLRRKSFRFCLASEQLPVQSESGSLLLKSESFGQVLTILSVCIFSLILKSPPPEFFLSSLPPSTHSGFLSNRPRSNLSLSAPAPVSPKPDISQETEVSLC